MPRCPHAVCVCASERLLCGRTVPFVPRKGPADMFVTCQNAVLRPTLSHMVFRLFPALLSALVGLMLVIAPIATPVSADHVPCKQQNAIGTHETAHAHHGAHAQAAELEPEQGNQSSLARANCCDHGCIIGVSILPGIGLVEARHTTVPTSWVVTDLTDLTDPNGLRRPPRS